MRIAARDASYDECVHAGIVESVADCSANTGPAPSSTTRVTCRVPCLGN